VKIKKIKIEILMMDEAYLRRIKMKIRIKGIISQ